MKRLKVSGALAMIFVLVMTTTVLAAPPVPGTGNTDVIVMNANTNTGDPNASVVAEYYNPSGVVEATRSPAGGVPSLGAFEFRAADSGLGDGWAGSVIVSADRDVTAVANTGYSGGSAEDGQTGSSYSGFSAGSTTIYIPSLFQRFQAQYSRITIQNMGSGTANITLNYYNRDGTTAATPIVGQIPEGAQVTYDLSQVGASVPDFADNLADGWIGSVVVTSDVNIGGISSTFWEHFSSAYESSANGSTRQTCPWVSRRFIVGDWVQSVGVIVQNLSASTEANVTLNWWNRDGTLAHTFNHTIPANSAKGYNTRVRADTPDPDAFWADLGDDWNGSLTITSDQPIASVVDMNWRRAGEQAANTYRCIDSSSGDSVNSVAADVGQTILFADVNRILTGETFQKYTSIIVQNLSSTPANVTVTWYDRNGNQVHQFNASIPGESSQGYNTRFVADTPDPGALHTALGSNFQGQVVVTSDQPISGLGTNTYIGDVDTYNAYAK